MIMFVFFAPNQLVPAAYKTIRDQLITMNANLSLPDVLPLNLTRLEDVGLYSVIESSLYDAMKVIIIYTL